MEKAATHKFMQSSADTIALYDFLTVGTEPDWSRYVPRIKAAFQRAACFVPNHDLECWDTQIATEENLVAKFSQPLSRLILNFFMSLLRRGEINSGVVEFIFYIL